MRKKRQNPNPGLETPFPMLSVCLPELPLLDLVRLTIFFCVLFFSENLHLPFPKKKATPPPWDTSAEAEAPAE